MAGGFPKMEDESPIEQGTSIVIVRDDLLASAMIAVGIPLRKDPPYTHVRLANGAEQWSYNFHGVDRQGHITAKECIEGWQQDVKWTAANPMHPFAFAMQAVKNYARLREHKVTSRPFHIYAISDEDSGGDITAKLFVIAGSEKEKIALAKGYVRI